MTDLRDGAHGMEFLQSSPGVMRVPSTERAIPNQTSKAAIRYTAIGALNK